jgi:arylsulfatase
MFGGTPTFIYRTNDSEAGLTKLAGVQLAPGRHIVTVNFTVEGVGLGRGGLVQLAVDGKPAGRARLERTIPFKFSPEGGAVGHDTGTPLIDDYRIPAIYSGVLRSVTVDLKPVQAP